jgi:hypothetical protein
MPVYTVVGTQYCAPRSGFLRLRRGPTRTSSARTLRITSRSKAEAVRMYRKAVGVGRDCELKVYASPESVTANRRRTSRRLQANAHFARFKILDASVERQDHAGRDVYRVDVEITAPRRGSMAFGGWGPTRTVSGDTMVIRVYPDGRFNMLDSRGMTQYLVSDLTEAQRKKVLAAVKKLGGKVPDIYGPRR